MSYIENLLGSPVIPEVQESLGLAAGNYKIKGFDLYASGDLVILDEGLALVDGLRIVSSANLKLPKSSVLSKYVFLRIYTYTEIIDGLHIRNADLSLIAQASSTPVNDTNLYDNDTGTKDVLLAYVNDSGIVDLTTNGALGVYDVPTRLTSVEGVNETQDTSISSLGTRMTAVETKNTTQDNRLAAIENYTVLWQGAYHMSAAQTIILDDDVLSQATGIILVWSKYDSPNPLNIDWHYFFIPKFHALVCQGKGVGMILRNSPTTFASKHVYVDRYTISGVAANTTAPNNDYVLRYVLGV